MVSPGARRLRVLVTSTPGAGHLGPLVPLAAALQAAGHVVLVATAEESCQRMRTLGFDVVAAGMGVADRVVAMAPRMPEIAALDPRERRSLLFTGFFGLTAAPRMHTDLGPVFGSFRRDVVIHEMAELAAAPMATGRGVPHVTVAFSGAIGHAALGSAVHSMDAIWLDEGVANAGVAELLGSMYLHPFPASFGEPPPYRNVLLVRPGPAGAGADSDAAPWLLALGGERPLVYVTAGTDVTSQSAPWAAALEALAAFDVDVVATVGPLVDIAVLGVVPPNVRVERFVPQERLLARARVVASHGGAGTVLGAAMYGVPQLLFPMAADQWDNADAVSRAGAGVVCEAADRGADAFAAALQRLLLEPAVQVAARSVAAEIAAMPSAADHVSAIEALVS